MEKSLLDASVEMCRALRRPTDKQNTVWFRMLLFYITRQLDNCNFSFFFSFFSSLSYRTIHTFTWYLSMYQVVRCFLTCGRQADLGNNAHTNLPLNTTAHSKSLACPFLSVYLTWCLHLSYSVLCSTFSSFTIRPCLLSLSSVSIYSTTLTWPALFWITFQALILLLSLSLSVNKWLASMRLRSSWRLNTFIISISYIVIWNQKIY